MSALAAPIQPPDPAKSTTLDRQKFMTRWTRLYARDLALEHVLTSPADHALRSEHFQAVMGFGFACKATGDEIIALSRVEWDRAIDYARRFLEAWRRRLAALCRAATPRDAVLAATEELLMDWGLYIPELSSNAYLQHILHDAAAHRIRQAVRPMFAAGAPKATIEAAADQANAGILELDHAAAIVRTELKRHRRFGRR